MAAHRLVVASLLIFCLAGTCYGKVHFSSLKTTLDVTASPKQGQGRSKHPFSDTPFHYLNQENLHKFLNFTPLWIL